MLTVKIPANKAKRLEQIKALKWQIEHDTKKKDKDIHKKALRALILAK